MAAGDIFQLTSVAILNGVPCANVYFLKVLDDSGTTDALKDAATALDDGPLFNLTIWQSNAYALECILGRQVFPQTSPSRVFVSTAVGTQGPDVMPANVAVKFPTSSGIGNKNQRGRYFIGGLMKTFVTDGRIHQSQETNFQLFINSILATITSSGRTYRMQHHSVKLDQYFDITVARVEPVPVKLRNRTPGLCSIS